MDQQNRQFVRHIGGQIRQIMFIVGMYLLGKPINNTIVYILIGITGSNQLESRENFGHKGKPLPGGI